MHLAWITAEGYNLFIFDYPGYGLSEGKPTPQSCVEAGHAALDWVLSHDTKNLPMIIYGQSMGGIIALRTVIDKRADINLKLVVAESTFDSFQQIARHKLSQHWLTWPLQPLSYLLLSDRWAPPLIWKHLRQCLCLSFMSNKTTLSDPNLVKQFMKSLLNPNRYGAFPMEAILIFSGSMKKNIAQRFSIS